MEQPKRAVSISLGSVTRDKKVTVTLLGQQVTIERIGTNGDVNEAIRLYGELDGKVDALGVGGIDLGLTFAGRYYPLYDAQKLTAHVTKTPVVDGGGVRKTLERRVAQFLEKEIGDQIQPKRVMITAGVDRYDCALSFAEAGYELLFGDLGFALGIPIAVRSLPALHVLGRILLPVVGRLPLQMIYPTGKKQEEIIPKFGKWYQWATVLSGDCLYIRRHMPERLDGKIIVTNTTTDADLEDFRRRGVRYLVTSTPRLDGRSFGTNMMEAAMIAASGKGRVLTTDEIEEILQQIGFQPSIQKLNE